jgi:AraC-like DNA-binding protein
VREDKNLLIETRFVGIERHLDKHQIEFWFTCTLRKVRFLTGERIVPEFVEWVHRRTRGIDEIEHYFGVLPTFGAGCDRLAFPAEAADLPFTDPDPHLGRFLLNVLEDIGTARKTRSNPLRTRIENAITPRLPHAMISQEEIARELGLSKRTLIRRLSEEGLSFRQVLDELRDRLAREYLDEGLPQAQIAWLLGFREPKGFARAFRRWTGASPGSFRRRERSARDLHFDGK